MFFILNKILVLIGIFRAKDSFLAISSDWLNPLNLCLFICNGVGISRQSSKNDCFLIIAKWAIIKEDSGSASSLTSGPYLNWRMIFLTIKLS